MKKILSLTLSILMIFSLAACGSDAPEAATLKFGAGSYSVVGAADATAEQNGYGKLDVTFAAVTVDADGKIGSCDLDVMSLTANFTTDGRAVGAAEAKTKRELGDAYGMVTYAGSAKEWHQQADAFEALVAGKTLEQVKALVVDGNKGTDEVINAGCTITVNEFVLAIEKAYNNAAASDITDADTLKVTAYAEQNIADASAEQNGENEYAVYLFAAAVNAEGKVVEAVSDCVDVIFTFDTAGKSTYDTAKTVLTKREQGTDYGMVAYAGSAKEWFEQADAFDALCVGKTGAEIANLKSTNGKGVEEVQTAGCTIEVSGLVAAASKI